MTGRSDLLRNPESAIGELAKRTGYAQSRVSTAVVGLVERAWADSPVVGSRSWLRSRSYSPLCASAQQKTVLATVAHRTAG